MTRDEVKSLLVAIQALYPTYKPQDLTLTIDTWQKLLENDDYNLIMNALYKYSRTSGSAFPPSSAQLLELIADDSVEVLTEGEIRAMLERASHNANYGADEEFNALPEDLKKAVGGPSIVRSWGKMEYDAIANEITRVVRAYNQVISRKKKEVVTPDGLNLNINNYLISGSSLKKQIQDLRQWQQSKPQLSNLESEGY